MSEREGSSLPEPVPEAAPAPGSPSKRWLGLTALLLAEYLAISVSFDARPLVMRAGLSGAFGYLGIAAPLLVVMAASVYMLAGDALRADARALLLAHGARGPLLPCLLLNVASYVGLFLLTGAITALPATEGALPGAWMASWFGLLLLTTLSLLAAAVPVRAILPLLRRTAGVLVGGIAAGVLAWLAGIASGDLFESLRSLTLTSVYLLLYPFAHGHILYRPDESILGVNDFFVEVAPVCSGLEGIGLIFVFTVLYLVSARSQLRFPRALLLLPLAITLVWIGNSVRIALLIAVGVHLSPQIALSGFHSKAGWLFFVAVALSVIAVAQRSRFFARTPRASIAADLAATWNPTATYLAPLLAMIATMLVTGLLSTGFDTLYVARVLAVLFALYVNRAHLPRPTWPPSWQAPALGVLVFGAWLALVPRPDADSLAAFRDQLAELSPTAQGLWLAARTLGFAVTVPIAEELGFRAFLLRRLIQADFLDVPKTRWQPIAVILSSLTFGFLHGEAWLAGTLAGFAYAYAQRLRGRTSDAIVAHAVTNALLALDALLFHQDWLWL